MRLFSAITMNICHVCIIPKRLILMRWKMHTQFETAITQI